MIETTVETTGFRFAIARDGKEVGRASLFLITNDLHAAPYGLLEDVFVEEAYRGQGLATELVHAVITKAKALGCYKLIGTSRNERPGVHAMYEGMGFEKYGAAFRMNF